ncbi:MAG: BBP7 family outer membrane beta-barrel protein [Planctomycetota bacterium]
MSKFSGHVAIHAVTLAMLHRSRVTVTRGATKDIALRGGHLSETRLKTFVSLVITSSIFLFSGLVLGAEFRTSVRGESLVRSASYQHAREEIVPREPPHEAEGYAARPPDAGYGGFEPHGARGVGDACPWGADYVCPTGAGWTYWGSLEFLFWWREGQDLPPLVTSGPATREQASAGVLGVAGTELLYPRESQLGGVRPGGRLSLGAWFDPCQFGGVGARWFALGDSTSDFEQDSSVVPVLARPFFNVEIGQEDAMQVAYPGSTTGFLSVGNTSRVSGGDVFYRRMVFESNRRRLDLILGYQFARIDTDLSITSQQQFVASGGTQPEGTEVRVSDSFDTRNSYHAGEIGLWGDYDRGPVTWSLLAKVGLGSMNQRTEIAGRTSTSVPQLAPTVTNQGLLALDTNSGIFKRNVFAVSPEVAFNGAYHLNEGIDLTFGYSFIYWNNVVQPASQIDRGVNPSQITGGLEGAARPAFRDSDTSYFVQGLNFGVQCVW